MQHKRRYVPLTRMNDAFESKALVPTEIRTAGGG